MLAAETGQKKRRDVKRPQRGWTCIILRFWGNQSNFHSWVHHHEDWQTKKERFHRVGHRGTKIIHLLQNGSVPKNLLPSSPSSIFATWNIARPVPPIAESSVVWRAPVLGPVDGGGGICSLANNLLPHLDPNSGEKKIASQLKSPGKNIFLSF